MHLHVCSFATSINKGVAHLLDTCEKNAIQLDIFGKGQEFTGHGDKLILLLKYLNTLSDQDIFMFVDGYDVLILAKPEEIIEKFLFMNADFVISAERNCHPYPELAAAYPESPTSFKYLCSGSFIGYVKKAKEIINDLMPIRTEDNDQGRLTEHFLKHPEKYTLDTQCTLFFPMYGVKPDEIVLDHEKKRVFCKETETFACIIHGNGNTLWDFVIYDALFPRPSIQKKVESTEDKTVLIEISIVGVLATYNQAYLKSYLQSIVELDYDKKKIDLYVNLSNVDDLNILQQWLTTNGPKYKSVIVQDTAGLAEMKNRSLQACTSDYYFSISYDCLILPDTVKELMSKKLPIIAPMLPALPGVRSPWTNFFVDESQNYFEILLCKKLGVFQVPAVFGCYLIEGRYLDKLTYIDETDDSPNTIFSRSASLNGVDQYIDNEKDFGSMIQFYI